MKSLKDFILEQISDKEELNSTESIDYSAFTEILLYIKSNDIFHDRIKAIIKKYKEDFNDSLSAASLKTTKIFKIILKVPLKRLWRSLLQYQTDNARLQTCGKCRKKPFFLVFCE